MVKILFLVTQSEFGGAQRYIYEIVSNLDSANSEVLVVAGQGEDNFFFQKLKNIPIKTRNLKWLKRAPRPWEIPLAIKEIYNLLKKEGPEILFLASTTAGLLGSLAVFLYRRKFQKMRLPSAGFKVIYRIGGWAFNDPRFWLFNKVILWLEKATAPFKDIIVVNSKIDYRLALRYKITPRKKILTIYNGLSPNLLNFFPREESRNCLIANIKYQIPGSNLKKVNFQLVGCVANFYKTKGLEYLIEAVKIIKTSQFALIPKLEGEKSEGIKLVIIGEGGQRSKLENLIKKYQLEKMVFLLGRIPDCYKYLKAFDVLVLPSLKEGFPWIILEAMAAEIPIVATNVGALPEIIRDGQEGVLVEPKNSQLLAEKINWILSHPIQAREMTVRAKEKLEKEFSLQKMIEETKKLLS